MIDSHVCVRRSSYPTKHQISTRALENTAIRIEQLARLMIADIGHSYQNVLVWHDGNGRLIYGLVTSKGER